MRVGIATCAERSDLTPGDRLFASALKKRGAQVSPAIWDDARFFDAGFEAVVIRSTWDYHKKYPRFLQWIDQVERASIRLINSPQVVRWNSDKTYLAELARKGVATVPTILIDQDMSNSEALARIQASGWRELIIKPSISATAYLTSRCRAGSEEIPRVLDQLRAHSAVLVQPYLASIETEGEVSLIYFNESAPEFSHAILKKPKAGDFRVQADFGGQEAPLEPSTDLIDFADLTLKHVPGDWVYARVDIVNWSQDPMLGELELIEPNLSLNDAAAETFAQAVMGRSK